MTDVSALRQHVIDIATAFHVELFTSLERARNHGFLDEASYAHLKARFPATPLPLNVACSAMHPDRVRRGVIAPTLTDAYSYAVHLHELGHHLSPSGQLRCFEPRPHSWKEMQRHSALSLAEEDAAWEWARRNALMWTSDMDRAEVDGLKTHRARHAEIELITRLVAIIGGLL